MRLFHYVAMTPTRSYDKKRNEEILIGLRSNPGFSFRNDGTFFRNDKKPYTTCNIWDTPPLCTRLKIKIHNFTFTLNSLILLQAFEAVFNIRIFS